MVLLTMTPAILAGLRTLNDGRHAAKTDDAKDDATDDAAGNSKPEEPSLDEPKLGNPISHGQIVDLWRQLKDSQTPCSLEQLLQGSHVYVPPPPPKKEPTPEYKALMARLRREEEERSYERMTNRGAPLETFHQRFPNASAAASFASVNRPGRAEDMGDDDVTFNDVHRQVMLLINFLVSIAGVAGTLWVAARWWTLPARLFLTMGGAAVVGIAEVTVYSVYVWRMGEAKAKQAAVREVKEVVQTWVVGKDGDEDAVLLKEKDGDEGDGPLRKRNVASKTET